MQNIKQKNSQLMSMLSIWGIVLVVLGHSGMAEPQIEPHVTILKGWIYSFHMPLFFFISGFLFSYTNINTLNIDAKKFILKKVDRLLVPYFALGIVSILMNNLNNYKNIISFDSVLAFIYPSKLGFLWYVATLFLIFCIVILLNNVFRVNIKSGKNILIISAICIIARIAIPHTEILNISDLLWYTPFFMLGIYAHSNERIFSLMNNTEYTIQHPYKTLLWGGILLAISILHQYQIINQEPVTSLLVRYFYALIGITISILLCNTILYFKKLSSKILLFSSYTYSTYLLSKFSQIPIRIITLKILDLHYIICILAMFILGIMIPILICKYVNKNRILSKSRIIRLIIGY